eukprot:TRINITY_DN9844_c0_g3_i1.p1 TRINITY_DN9844_c0_g3~~TRINITY_DN9844_c0_g3_i1.p1  ORF type:complete len:529 (+),score=153.14 TRINITY_DN9844_c0_g3_i1:258-1844(+)
MNLLPQSWRTSSVIAAKRKRNLSTPPIDSDGEDPHLLATATNTSHGNNHHHGDVAATATGSSSPPKSPWHSKLKKTKTLSPSQGGGDDATLFGSSDEDADDVDAIVEQRRQRGEDAAENNNHRNTHAKRSKSFSSSKKTSSRLDDDLIDFATNMDNAPPTPPKATQQQPQRHHQQPQQHSQQQSQPQQHRNTNTSDSHPKINVSSDHQMHKMNNTTPSSPSKTTTVSSAIRFASTSTTASTTEDVEIQDILTELAEDVTQEMIEENMELLKQLEAEAERGGEEEGEDNDGEEGEERRSNRRKLPFWMNKTHSAGMLEILDTKRKQEIKARCRDLVSSKENVDVSKVDIKIPSNSGRVIVLDLETTGFGSDDSVIEIGAVELKDGTRTGCVFQSYAKPLAPIHPCAFEAHKLTDNFLAEQDDIAAVLKRFLQWVGNDTSLIVCHNAAFDLRMLKQEIERAGLPIMSIPSFCTQRCFQKYYPQRSYSLSSVAAYLDIQYLPRTTHGALLDAEITSRIFSKMVSRLRQTKR